ncbi:hypothetical protein OHC33_002550 [Knufia fluminis]|uniref:Uncharacterized protein n=1 Tax=Knufia fluminis TaxID=191047 RepID=A0AAN8EPZ1_9EURO|nr:hypothetical protein OHC33_002550 [Knufia fluminis]
MSSITKTRRNQPEDDDPFALSNREIQRLTRHDYYTLLQRRLGHDEAMIDDTNHEISMRRTKLDKFIAQRNRLKAEEVSPKHIGLVFMIQCIKDIRAVLRRLERQRKDYRKRLRRTEEEREKALREDGQRGGRR